MSADDSTLRVALVTGATRGIGRVIAEALGQAGFAVASPAGRCPPARGGMTEWACQCRAVSRKQSRGSSRGAARQLAGGWTCSTAHRSMRVSRPWSNVSAGWMCWSTMASTRARRSDSATPGLARPWLFPRRPAGVGMRVVQMAKAEGPALDRLVPGGADIYFDHVGGLTQRPVFDRLKPFGRLIVCGMAAEYCGTESSTLPTGMILAKRLRIQGCVVLDHENEYPEFRADIARLLREGKFTYQTTVYDGIEQAPQALVDCLSGHNAGGKLIVKVGGTSAPASSNKAAPT